MKSLWNTTCSCVANAAAQGRYKRSVRLFLTLSTMLGLSIATAQTAAPFGLTLGMSADDLRRLGAKPIDNAPGRWALDTPPISNANFSSYVLVASPKQGLCKITALGVTLNNDSYGEKARAKHKELSNIVTQKYGKSTSDYDFLTSGSIWNRPNDFAMAVNKEDRVLTSYWLNLKGSPVTSIGVLTRSLNSSDTYVNVTYELNNFNACSKELESTNGDGM